MPRKKTNKNKQPQQQQVASKLVSKEKEVEDVEEDVEEDESKQKKEEQNGNTKNNNKDDARTTNKKKEQDDDVDATGDGPEKRVKASSTAWTGTGVLESLAQSRDIKIGKFSVSLHGVELVKDANLELNYGNRYGLIGLNGTGKSTLLRVLGERQVPIPKQIDIYYLSGEDAASDLTALDSVLSNLDEEIKRLEKEAEELVASAGAESEQLAEIYERLDELEPTTARTRAGKILHGLGFSSDMQKKKTKDYSGGWRMRISLARALFVSPIMLLLDEPTNHLDLEACIWLEEYLKTYKRILVVISHSQDFLNGVCTNIIHLHNQDLVYYGGNYDQYVITRKELEDHQMKQYYREQDEIAHMKDYIARFGHGSAKLARQAKSKEKVLSKMVEKGLTERVTADKVYKLRFEPCGFLAPPIMAFSDVSFGYTPGAKNNIYSNITFSIDLDSRVALVGPNGAGKSTLLKMMCGEVSPSTGMVRCHQHLRMARYHQHLQDHLDDTLSPLEYMSKEFPLLATKTDQMRQELGKFGVTGKVQTLPIQSLSDGQKSRVVFAWLALKTPHILLLDEPTNHLDIETIDALAEAIKEWDGGLVLVSHDFRLIGQVAKEIWECKGKRVTKWNGDIMSYKKKLRAEVLKETE